MRVFFRNIPTREIDGTWTYTTFDTLEDFRDFVKSCFKEPGKYEFDSTAYYFNEHASNFAKTGVFCVAPKGSRDYVNYWDTEREKCRKGVIFKGVDKVWFLPRHYYHWINFLQIGGKESGIFQFPSMWDTQYHLCLYETLAQLFNKNAVVLKKRQIASSYVHACKIFNQYIFEQSYVAKMLASKKTYIDATNGTWKMFNEYQNFTNKHTAWACGNSPDKVFSWEQKVEEKTPDGRKITTGTHATIIGITMDKDPVAGVGGRVSEVFYEEGGVAPTADITYEYMLPALKQGSVITGIFILAGSVGELDQCTPLQNFMNKPEASDFYGVETDLVDGNGTVGIRGLFIPEQWSFPPYIDKYGNSKVTEALQYLNDYYEAEKKRRDPDKYQLLVSQGPRNIAEAFAMRTTSVFPAQHTNRQIQRIEDNEYAIEYVDLERNDKNEIVAVASARRPISDFPLPMTTADKKSIVCIHERPIKDAAFGSYLCAIDPVEVGKSTTSPSLASIHIYKMDIEVETREVFKKKSTGKEGEDIWGVIKRKNLQETTETKVTNHIEGGKLVAWWCGRFDDPNETNEYISRLVEFYRARALCENNKPGFINYMISKKRQKYLILGSEMVFDKELGFVAGGNQPYGIHMTTRLWKMILEDAINSLSEVIHQKEDEHGNITRVHYGVERITDIMVLKEMQAYVQGLNVDRLISYALLISLVKIFQAAGRVRKKVERTTDQLESPSNNSKFISRGANLLNNIGKSAGNSFNQLKGRNLFKNLK